MIRRDVAAAALLCWHQIRAQTAADSARDRAYVVSPKVLAEQLDALDRAGDHAVTGEALVAHVAIGKPLRPKPAARSVIAARARLNARPPSRPRLQLQALLLRKLD